jgi:hypothetical protein
VVLGLDEELRGELVAHNTKTAYCRLRLRTGRSRGAHEVGSGPQTAVDVARDAGQRIGRGKVAAHGDGNHAHLVAVVRALRVASREEHFARAEVGNRDVAFDDEVGAAREILAAALGQEGADLSAEGNQARALRMGGRGQSASSQQEGAREGVSTCGADGNLLKSNGIARSV